MEIFTMGALKDLLEGKAKVKEDGDADNDGKPDTGDKEAYQKFFQQMLKKYGVESPEELSDEDRKKFYDEIDAKWKANKETDVDEACGKPHGKKKKMSEAGEGDSAEYQAFFKKALKKFGVTEPDQLKGDKKKEFFDYIDKNWKSDDEEKGIKESIYSILSQSVELHEAEKKKEDEKKAKDAKAKAKDDKGNGKEEEPEENPAHLKLDERPPEEEIPDVLTIEFPEGVFLKLKTGTDENFEQIKVKAQKLYADGEDTAVIAKALADEFKIEEWEIKDVNKMGEEEEEGEEEEPKVESKKSSLADILNEASK